MISLLFRILGIAAIVLAIGYVIYTIAAVI